MFYDMVMQHNEDDWDNDDAWDETVSCPQCDLDIHEDSVSCPGCGHYLTERDRTASRRPGGWFLVIVIAVIISLLFPLIGNLLSHLFQL